jgi:serine/threonine protein kinase
VLELVEGETLAVRVQRGPASLTDAITIARQIADALDAAHEKGIFIEISNRRTSKSPRRVVKVPGLRPREGSDRRVAIPDGDRGQHPEGTILGTAAYMSPEQARGQAVDKRTDIWAFGCVVYELLTGRLAFQARRCRTPSRQSCDASRTGRRFPRQRR